MLRRSLALLQLRASLQSSSVRQFSITNRLRQNQNKKDTDDEDEINDEPYKYSTSKAASWKAEDTFYPKSDAPPIQGPLVVLSISVFMMYFCIIREENDIDEGLYNLNPIVPGATKGR